MTVAHSALPTSETGNTVPTPEVPSVSDTSAPQQNEMKSRGKKSWAKRHPWLRRIGLALLILVGGESIGQWRDLPAPYFLTGLFGVGLFIVLSLTIPRVGAAGTTTLIVAGQFVVAMLIDQFGWFGVPQSSLSLTRIAGAVLLVAGAYLISLSPAST